MERRKRRVNERTSEPANAWTREHEAPPRDTIRRCISKAEVSVWETQRGA